MAKFSFNGIDEITASFEQLARLSDEEKISVIRPSAEVLSGAYRRKLSKIFEVRTGDLISSLTISKRSDENGVLLRVFPKGKHRSSRRDIRKRRRINGEYSGTNAEIGYILEYGSPRISAFHWMETANEEASDEVVAAQQGAWNDLITKKGL